MEWLVASDDPASIFGGCHIFFRVLLVQNCCSVSGRVSRWRRHPNLEGLIHVDVMRLVGASIGASFPWHQGKPRNSPETNSQKPTVFSKRQATEAFGKKSLPTRFFFVQSWFNRVTGDSTNRNWVPGFWDTPKTWVKDSPKRLRDRAQKKHISTGHFGWWNSKQSTLTQPLALKRCGFGRHLHLLLQPFVLMFMQIHREVQQKK